MQFLRADALSRKYGDTVFRESRRGKLVAFVIFLGLTLGALFVGSFPGALPPGFRPPRFIALFSAAGLLLISLLSLYSLRASLMTSNWLLRFDGVSVFVKFRSYLNHHFPEQDEVVVQIPSDEIAWIRDTREDRLLPQRRGDSLAKTTILDIKLRDVDTSELKRRLAEERRRQAPQIRRTRTKAQHYPVRLLGPDLLRIDWRDHRTRIVPAINEAIGILGRRIRVADPESLAQEPAESLSRQEQETRLLELAQRGDLVAATRLAQRLYGFSTTEAKRFVDELAGR